MEFHILKDQDGKTYQSGHTYSSRLEADKQAAALQDELEDKALVYVLDDIELLALRSDPKAKK